MENATVAGKRGRESEDTENVPEAKRCKENLLSEILSDDDGLPAGEVEDAMRRLEEEIGLAPSGELGYLLEASDDELGIPPATAEASPSVSEGVEGLGQMWGFEDGIWSELEGFGFGVGSGSGSGFGGEEEEVEGLVVGEGLFEGSSWPSDLAWTVGSDL